MTELKAQENLIEQIRNDILCGNFMPRERLVESDLMKKYGATRNAIRKAFQELQAQKMVIHKLNCGVTVAEVKEKDAMELYRVRVLLEAYAAQRIMANLNESLLKDLRKLQNKFVASVNGDDFKTTAQANISFHESIFQVANNPVITGLIMELRNRSNLLLYLIWRNPNQFDKSIQDHEEMLATLQDRDLDGFVKINSKHIMASLQGYIGKSLKQMGFDNIESGSYNINSLIEVLA